MKIQVLKPCPLCGSDVKITEYVIGTPYNNGKNVDYSATIDCPCGLSFEKEWIGHKAKDKYVFNDEDIYTAWNKRVR